MTSKDNHLKCKLIIMSSPNQIIKINNHLKRNKFFGYKEKDLILFSEESIPCVNLQGKVLMQSKTRVMLESSGTGSFFR